MKWCKFYKNGPNKRYVTARHFIRNNISKTSQFTTICHKL